MSRRRRPDPQDARRGRRRRSRRCGPTFGLTPRELELVGSVVAGCSNSDIADLLGISSEDRQASPDEYFQQARRLQPAGAGALRRPPPVPIRPLQLTRAGPRLRPWSHVGPTFGAFTARVLRRILRPFIPFDSRIARQVREGESAVKHALDHFIGISPAARVDPRRARARGGQRREGPADGRERRRQGGRQPRHPSAQPPGAHARWWRSTASGFRKRCSNRSCSATSAAVSPAPAAITAACSSAPTAARSSSTKSVRWDCGCRPCCCAFSKPATSSESAPIARPRRSTCGSSRRPTAIRSRWSDRRTFREDLYYRLNVVEISIPPLRERREDIPVLFDYFMEQYGSQHGLRPPTLAPEAARLDPGSRLAGQHPAAEEHGRAPDHPAAAAASDGRGSLARRRRSDAAAGAAGARRRGAVDRGVVRSRRPTRCTTGW